MWATSGYSNGRRGECVQVADLPATVAVRDSKHPEAGALAFPRQKWAALLGAVRTGGL